MKFLKLLVIFINFIVVIFLFLSSRAFSQELKARFQDWSIFKTERGDKVICYVASTPIKTEGNFSKRGDPFFLVTQVLNDSDEVSLSSGFIYDKNSNVELNFGSKKYYLFPFKATAWANDKNDDADIIKEMQSGSDMVITGVTRDGRIAIDTYSLIGFAESYKKLKDICLNQL